MEYCEMKICRRGKMKLALFQNDYENHIKACNRVSMHITLNGPSCIIAITDLPIRDTSDIVTGEMLILATKTTYLNIYTRNKSSRIYRRINFDSGILR